MNIGYLHNDGFSLKRGESVQSWQISLGLSKKHSLFGTKQSKFNHISRIYNDKRDTFSFFKKIDLLFTIVDGYLDFYNEKFTFLAKIFGKPNVWLLNSPIEETFSFNVSKFSFYKQKITRLFLARFVDHAICISKEMENYAKNDLGIKSTSVISNGADPVLFNPELVSKNFLLDNKKFFKVLWSGNGEFTWQALDTIIDVAKKLQKEHKDIIFIIISDKIWPILKTEDNILFLNAVDYHKLPQYIAAADLCLCLYHEQKGVGFYRSPMKLFDYMSMGKPILASNLGQLKSVILDKKNGFLVKDSVKDIANKIIYLKNNGSLLKKVGRQARKDVLETYSWDKILLDINKIISKF